MATQMGQDAPQAGALAVLAEAFRARRTGVLVVGRGAAALRARLDAGQIVAIGPAANASQDSRAKPDDSVRLRLERLLAEVGVRPPQAKPEPSSEPLSLRDRLIEDLANVALASRFDDAAEQPPGLVHVAVATEPVILEAVRRLRHDEAVRQALGDLDRQPVATAALAEERTLSLTEGYLLSRIDGMASLRDVLEQAPLDPGETERALLGLLLTGRLECPPQARTPRTAPPAAAASIPTAEVESAPPAVEATVEPAAPIATVAAPAPMVGESAGAPPAIVTDLGETAASGELPPPPAAGPDAKTEPLPALPVKPQLDAAALARRREILELFQALPLKNHFEVLGVEPGCSDADVRRAYVALAKRFHPDARRDSRLDDIHDIMEAIFIRIGEAWEVLGDARSRASYEARSGVVKGAGAPTAQAPSAPETPEYVPPEEILLRARRLLSQARYWDAIQMLEWALPGMEPRAQQHRGRLLLARAYSKNPNWLRRAEEMLQQLLREDPTNADVLYELGLIYKAGGFVARAQGMFRRAVELRPGHKEAAAELGLQPPAEGGGGLLKRFFKRGKAS